MSDHPGGPDWERSSDNKWYAPGVLSGAGWWRATDDRWYPPEAPQQPAQSGSHSLPKSRVTGGIDLLNTKTVKVLRAQISDLTPVEFCLVGNSSQAMIAFPDRLVIVKAGVMAGASFGGRATEFRYEHIHGIQVNTGMVNGTIEIHTASLGATKAGDYFSTNNREDPFKLPNVLPIAKVNVKLYQPYLDLLRTRLGVSSSPANPVPSSPPPVGSGSADLVDRLKELTSLHDSGALTAAEFEQAKRKLLG